MLVVEVQDQPVGRVRENVAIYVRYSDRGQWSGWHRSGQRPTVEAARAYVKEEAARDTSLGGLVAPSGPRQFMLRTCVETTLEVWDTSAKKIEPTRKRKRV